jgi:hypothetical protein
MDHGAATGRQTRPGPLRITHAHLPARSRATNSKVPAPKPAASVDAFLASLEHPFKREILALRQIMLGIDPAITEEIKWNAPSFRTTEHFATMQLRAKVGVQLILHFGARKRDTTGITIDGPHGLLEWLGPDRPP